MTAVSGMNVLVMVGDYYATLYKGRKEKKISVKISLKKKI